MRFLLPGLLLFAVLTPVRAQDDPPPDEGDPNAKVFLTLDPGHHVGPISELLFTPDGQRLVSAGEDRTIQVWDAHSGERLRVFRPPVGSNRGGTVLAAALAPDGKTLACGAIGVIFEQGKPARDYLYLLNLEDGRLLPLPKAGAGIHAVAFSPDGNRLAVSFADGVDVYQGLKGIWDRKDPALKPWKTFVAGVRRGQLAFAPDGSRLAACTFGDEAIRIWDLDRGGKAALVEPSGKLDRAEALAWSRDGKRLVSGHSVEEQAALPLVCVWSPEGKELQRFTATDLSRAGVPALRGKLMAVARVFFRGDHELLLLYRNPRGARAAALFDLESHRGRLVVRNDSYHGAENAGALAPDGRRAALAAAPDGRRIALFDVGEKAELQYLQGDEPAENQVGWGKDGYTIAWRGPGQASDSWLDLKRLERLPAAPGPLFRAVTERDGWSLKRVGRHLELSRGGQAMKTANVLDASTSFTLPAAGDVTWIAWTDLRGLHLNDAATGDPVRHFRPRWVPMRSLTSSPDGKYLLVYSTRSLFHVYRPDQVDPLLTVYASGPDWVVWTKEGYYAATPGGERLFGWTVNNGPDKLASFYPAERFRKQLYRPDVVGLVLEKGGVAEALKARNATATNVEELLPPVATLQVLDEPRLPEVKEKVKVRATATAAAKGQPVTSLQLRVDGRPLPDSQGLLELQEGRANAAAEWDVVLPPGDHELTVLARSPDSAAGSEAVPVRVPQPGQARPVLHLVAVGIDAYQDGGLCPGVKFAGKDARDLADAFQKGCAGEGNLFGKVQGGPLLNGQATHAAVLGAVREVRKQAHPGDLVVVSFAGHGVQEGKDFYLLTVEADTTKLARTAVAGRELRDALKDMPCQVLLILDACHSAAGIKAFKRAGDEAARGLTDDACGVAVFGAAMGQEYAQETEGNGLFTKALVEALTRSERVPYNSGDGRQYVHHLHAFVFDEVQRRSDDRQHPFLNLPWVTQSFPVRRLPARPASSQAPGDH